MKISGLLAVNYTLLAAAGVIIVGGSLLGLALYFIASSARSRYAYNQQYAQSRMMGSFDALGLLATAVKFYQEMNDSRKSEE